RHCEANDAVVAEEDSDLACASDDLACLGEIKDTWCCCGEAETNEGCCSDRFLECASLGEKACEENPKCRDPDSDSGRGWYSSCPRERESDASQQAQCEKHDPDTEKSRWYKLCLVDDANACTICGEGKNCNCPCDYDGSSTLTDAEPAPEELEDGDSEESGGDGFEITDIFVPPSPGGKLEIDGQEGAEEPVGDTSGAVADDVADIAFEDALPENEVAGADPEVDSEAVDGSCCCDKDRQWHKACVQFRNEIACQKTAQRRKLCSWFDADDCPCNKGNPSYLNSAEKNEGGGEKDSSQRGKKDKGPKRR
ncbi:MAG: hypothetical protein QGI45_03200, partial [Myxococcota bacterium]|nr:hypothetical protein [Myxococcota bacterium]